MLKFLCLISLVFYGVTIDAQTQRIDSIRRLLPRQDKEAAVNSLNGLAREFYFYWVHSDSALKYADLAFHRAALFNYTSGMAEALSLKSGIQSRLLGQPSLAEKHSLKALDLLKGSPDANAFSIAYHYSGLAYALLGKQELAHQAMDRALQYGVASRDTRTLGWAQEGKGFAYYKSGEYWKCFDYMVQAQQLGKQANDSVLVSLSLAILGRTFNRAGDPQQALNYYHEAMQHATPFLRLWSHREDMAYAQLQLKQYDSALYYQSLNKKDLAEATTDEKVRKKFTIFSWGYSVEVQLLNKDYEPVLQELLPALPKLRQSGNVFPYMQALLILGKIYEAKKNDREALRYARELYAVAHQTMNGQGLKDASELLSSIFNTIKRTDSAYHYHRQFVKVKDSLQTAQYSGKTALYLAASESRNKIKMLQRDNELNQRELALTKKEIGEQSKLKKLLIAAMGLLLVLFIVLFRNNVLRRRNENLYNQQQQSILHRKTLELEMQALRAQMNPHFIFNCLSAIDNLIQTNQADKATTCLSRFARLIRNVLDSSKNNLVPFQKDFDTMKLYLELEQFRCNNKFQYQLLAADELLQGDYKVPPLIVQPFIENAIHHGLLNKQEGSREVTIQARLERDDIVYYVTDNGIGRSMAENLKAINRPNQQSYGIAITKERIQLHNKNEDAGGLLIRDLVEEGKCIGTEAIIRISCAQ